MLGLFVVGQVVAHHLAHVEVVGELEGKHGVVDFLLAHLVDVFLGAHLVGILVVVGDAAAEHDGLQVELLAEVLAVFVHTAGQAKAAVLRMDEDLDAIEDIPFGVVGIERLLARHLGIGVVVLHVVIIDDDGKGAAHNLLVDHRHDLPLGEDAYQFLYLLVGPEDVASVRIDTGERLGQLVVVFNLQIAYLHLVNLDGIHFVIVLFVIRFCYSQSKAISLSTSSSRVAQLVTKRTTVSVSPRGPHSSKVASRFSRSMVSLGRQTNCWLVGESRWSR